MRARLTPPRPSKSSIVVAVFIVGIALRVVFMLDYRPAFLGIPDAGSYIAAAQRGVFVNVYDPAGYPLFVRITHFLYPHLSALILLQHALGVATAALFYLAVRRVTGSTWLGLIPAMLILFDGFGLWVEHTPISEPLFGFLIAAALYVSLRAATGSPWLLVAAGLLIGASGTVRPVGFLLIPFFTAWVLWARGGAAKTRLLAAVMLAGPACLLVATYMVVQRAQTGFTGVTQDSGRVLYARVARFADCSQFSAPRGTAGLCERTPPGKRASSNQYLTGFPDGARQVTVAGRSISPAWRLFGPPPGGNGKLTAFALTAIVHQPLDYVDAVATDFHYYWVDDHQRFIAAAARVDPGIEQIVTGYYKTGAGVDSDGLGFVRWYGRTIEVSGVLMIVLLLAPLVALRVTDPGARRAAVLLAATGWLMPLLSDAAATVDPRYILPSYGPLAAASAIGLAGLSLRRALPARAVGTPPQSAAEHAPPVAVRHP